MTSLLTRQRFGRPLCAIASGLALWLSFPKFGTGAVAWLALTPLLVALCGVAPGRAARLGFLTGLVAGPGLYYWTALVISQYGGLGFGASIPIMLSMCVVLALYPALFAWMTGLWCRLFGSAALLLAPVAWVATEILRGHTVLRFSWCLLGYSQAESPLLVQSTRWGGVYAVSFVLVLASATIAYMIVEPSPARARRTGLATLGLLALLLLDGWTSLARPIPETGRVLVGLIQANIPQDEKWAPEMADANVDTHVALTGEAAASGARLIVWPESAVPYYYDDAPEMAARLDETARRHGVYLFFGNDDREIDPTRGDRYFVGAKLLTPEGRLAYRYHKINLVPFGEYVPLQGLLTLGGRLSARLVRNVSDFTPGRERTLADVDGHKVAGFICYEAIYPDLVSEFVSGGAELLVNITNDAWYGWTSAPYQHFAMARLRAVETGRFLLRAANTGISAVVDPRGRVVSRTGLFEPRALVARVPFVTETTFYTRHRDLFAWACFAAAAALTVVSVFGRSPR